MIDTSVFIAAPFTICRKWRQAKCPTTGGYNGMLLTYKEIGNYKICKEMNGTGKIILSE